MWEPLVWRGSLLPLECEALPKSWGRYAAQREQAPSPHKPSLIENLSGIFPPMSFSS